jgi:hypothetical protein
LPRATRGLVTCFVRFVGKADVHFRVFVVFARHRIGQISRFEPGQTRGIRFLDKMFLGLDIRRYVEQSRQLLISRLARGFCVTAVLEAGERLPVHGRVEILARRRWQRSPRYSHGLTKS